MSFADLHIHTDYSDGTYSPGAIVAGALQAGLSVIAITDHDSTNGVDPAILAADGRLEVIAGVEMAAEHNGEEVHILGYFVDHKAPSFQKILEEMRRIRVERIYGICDKLKGLNFPVDPEEVFALAGRGSVGRMHVARALLAHGHVTNTSEAFRRFIGDKGPAYVSKSRMTPAEAIRFIRDHQGVPVLAHPSILSENALISDFVRAGIRGLEVFYSEHSDYQVQEYLKIADRFGLVPTGGSDFHGDVKEHVMLGRIKLPVEYVERLRAMR